MITPRNAVSGSRAILTAMLLGGSTLAMAQTAPIVQPGAPGQAGRTLTAEEATELAKATYVKADVAFMQGHDRPPSAGRGDGQAG
jgi:hypothetical protein